MSSTVENLKTYTVFFQDFEGLEMAHDFLLGVRDEQSGEIILYQDLDARKGAAQIELLMNGTGELTPAHSPRPFSWAGQPSAINRRR